MPKNKKQLHSKVGDFVRGNDLFGHTVNLNFNKKGTSHNTVIGGVFSIAIKFFMLIYIPLLWEKMILSEGNQSIIEQFILDRSSHDSVMNLTDS